MNEFTKEIISALCLRTRDFEELRVKYVNLQEITQKSAAEQEVDKKRDAQTLG